MHPKNLHSPPYRTLPDEQQSRKPIRKKWKSNEARATQQREKKWLAMGIPQDFMGTSGQAELHSP